MPNNYHCIDIFQNFFFLQFSVTFYEPVFIVLIFVQMKNVMNWDFFNKHVFNLKTLLVGYIQGHCDLTCAFTVNEIILEGLLIFTLQFCEKLSALHASVNCRSAFSSNILKQLFSVWFYLLDSVTSVHWDLQAFVYAQLSWSPTTDFQSGLKKSGLWLGYCKVLSLIFFT